MNSQGESDIFTYKCGKDAKGDSSGADPVTTELVRNALGSAVTLMMNTVTRVSCSPIVYEANDFCVALYDRDVCLLSQAPTLPIFLGTMNFCIEAAVESVGGEGALEPGDILLYNMPYGTGSHAQDAAVVMPVFLDDKNLIGYATNKAHWYDIGAKNPYCTDTEDLFQEGVIFPGVKIYKAGVRNDDIFRMVEANTRTPVYVLGDVHAQVAAARVGAEALINLHKRFGTETFDLCVQRMFDHGEALVRSFFEKLPDGQYQAGGTLDNDGLTDDEIDFELGLEIKGSTIRIDFSSVPDALAGPMNCPFPSTVSGARVTVGMMLGESGTPTEGHFRPLEVVTRPGSIFHPVSPQPCYLYGWPLMTAMETIYQAFSKAADGLVQSGSAGDICAVQAYGYDSETGEFFFNGYALPVGNGAQKDQDGATLYVPALARSLLPSAEIQEAKFPFLFRRWEMATDSCGPGRHRGGLGINYEWEVSHEARLISTMEQTKNPGWAQRGGLSGRSNRLEIQYPDGRTEEMRKVTGLRVPKGTIIKIYTGGGGGYGPPGEREPDAVKQDLAEGYISETHAREYYPQAFV